MPATLLGGFLAQLTAWETVELVQAEIPVDQSVALRSICSDLLQNPTNWRRVFSAQLP